MKQSVLIVDDEFGLADITADLLRDAGYEVTLAINGKLALEMLAAHRIDLVLTDLMMPVMDGPELIRRMRADARFTSIPAVLMTALPEAIPDGQAGQYDAVLVKPFSIQEVLGVVERLLPSAPREREH